MSRILQASAYLLAVLLALHFWPDGFDPKELRGKHVLVTGASSGIGEQLAMEYAKLGARLVITARREELLLNVAERCRALGALEVHAVAADMAKEADRERLVKSVGERLQGSLDHLVLNHATLRNGLYAGTPENMTALRKDLEVNFVSFVDLATRLAPLLETVKGKIGVVSSVAGKMGNLRMQVYASTKFALHGFFQSWRQELRWRDNGISITMCVLGPIDTDHGAEIIAANYPHLDRSWGASPRDTAVAIMRAVETRQYEMFYDGWACLMVLLGRIAPGWSEDMSTIITMPK